MKTLIIDGNNMGHRAFGIAPMTHKDQRTEAIKVGLAMVKKYIMKFLPDKCVIAWDGGHDERRTSIFPEYKKKRKRTEAERKELEAFITQLKKLQEALKDLGIVQYRCRGREADDVIYNLIMEGDKHFDGNHYTVVSTDKDFFQLFTYWFKLKIYSPQQDKLITKKVVEEELGISIDYYIEYKALIGDVSDNLPGVKGIGPVWGKWLVNNVLEREFTGKEKWDKEQKIMVGLMIENAVDFYQMKDLIEFKDIDGKELAAGRIEDRPGNLAILQERALGVCQQYGLTQFLDYFPQFVEPFEHLWRNQK